MTIPSPLLPEISNELEWARSLADLRIEAFDGQMTAQVKGPRWVVSRLEEAISEVGHAFH